MENKKNISEDLNTNSSPRPLYTKFLDFVEVKKGNAIHFNSIILSLDKPYSKIIDFEEVENDI